jgi:putative oxidoreductase
MKTIFATNGANTTALIARLALGIVVFPHGAQKLLGWFGGYGFEGTMGFLTGSVGLPWIVALLVILIEFFGSLMLIVGAATRVAALGILGNFIGVFLTSHLNSGFFMNWKAEANLVEGLEYFILLFGLALIALIAGGGRASVDAALTKNAELQWISVQSTVNA